MASEHIEVISVEPSLVEQQSPDNNHQNENSIQNQLSPRRTINMAEKGPMNPTPLEYSFWATHPTTTAVGAWAIFVVVIIAAGVLIVYFTSSKVANRICLLNFTPTPSDPIDYNYGPRSVAVGDVNNDTWLDIVVANHLSDQIGIFLNNGDDTFTSPQSYSTGAYSTPYMVAVGDFNNDHRLDIAVANFDTNSIGVFLGFGNGSFGQQIVTSTASSRPRWISIADLDKDTQLDIVTANHGYHSIGILYGYGNGSFSVPTLYLTGDDSFPFSVVAGDFNNDNYLDLSVANHGTNNVGIFLADNNGSFADQKILSTGIDSQPYSLAVGHLNDDYLLDIVVANHGTDSIGILLGCGNGAFISQTNYSFDGVSPYSIDVGDFNRDNQLDLVVTNAGSNNIAILLGNGNGSFFSLRTYSTGSVSSISVVADDLNNDNRLDIVVISDDTYSIDVLFGIDEGFPYQTTYSTGLSSLPQFVAVHDFNNDTYLDIVVANSAYRNIGIRLGYSNGSFEDQITYSTCFAPASVAVGDLNGDNHLDIVIACSYNLLVGVLLGYGNGSFAHQTTFFVPAYSKFVFVSDINNDSRLDIIDSAFNNNNIYLLLGYGNGSFTYPLTYTTAGHSQSVAVGDFNNDNRQDIVVANYHDTDGIGVLLGYGNGSFANQITFATGVQPFSIAVGDFNNDKQLDLVVANNYGRSVSVFLGYGNGSFSNQITYTTGASPTYVAVGDFNNDTFLDVVVTNYKDNTVTVLSGYGNGSFASQMTYATGTTPYCVAVGDLNNDTRLDLVVANWDDSTISVLLHYDSGALGNERTFASGNGSRLRDVVIYDIDRDTNLDIIVANYGTNNIGVLSGHGNGTFGRQRLFTSGSNTHPYSIAVGDFNKDNEWDIVVANVGTKNISILLGKGEKMFALQSNNGSMFNLTPCAIAAGDLNNDGQSEILLAYNNTDDVDVFIAYDSGMFLDQKTYFVGGYPLMVASCDFNNDNQLDIFVANVDDYNIGILLGYGDGSFAKQITSAVGYLPSPGAIGDTIHSAAISDFNNDNYLDVVVTTLNGVDNICVLLGYGNGSFMNSVLYTTAYRPESVTVGDFNNDTKLDVVITNQFYSYVGIFFGYGNGSFARQRVYDSGDSPSFLVAADLNDDYHLDIVVANYYKPTISIFLGYGNGSFVRWKEYSCDSRPIFVSVSDLNNDDRLDIVVGNNNAHGNVDVLIFLGFGIGSFAQQITYSTFVSAGTMDIGDINNDNQLDIVVIGGDVVHIFLGQGDGSFEKKMTYIVGQNSMSLAIADFNNDNRLDIVVANSRSNNVGVLIGYANQAVAQETTLITGDGSRPQSFVICDFNNDDQMDVAVANSGSNSVGLFFGYNNYSFTNQITYDTGSGSSPRSITVGDFNKDNYLDIVVANCGNDKIGVLFGSSDGSFSSQKTFTTGSHSRLYSVAVGDFNNDMLPDIVVANYDTNQIGVFISRGDETFANILLISTVYGAHPIQVVVGDFDNNRKLDFAVANEGTDNLKIFLQTCK